MKFDKSDKILLTWSWHDGEIGSKIVTSDELSKWKAKHAMALGVYLRYGTRVL